MLDKFWSWFHFRKIWLRPLADYYDPISIKGSFVLTGFEGLGEVVDSNEEFNIPMFALIDITIEPWNYTSSSLQTYSLQQALSFSTQDDSSFLGLLDRRGILYAFSDACSTGHGQDCK